MPAKRRKEEISGQFFRWLVWQRNGVYYADGRSSNTVDAGRHSLGTDDRQTALKALERLDLIQAVAHGRADRSVLEEQGHPLALADGRKLYEEYIGRPRIARGVKPASRKRYRAVLDKFLAFAKTKGVQTWNQVNKRLLEQYSAQLESDDYAYATLYLELTTIKQILNWLVDEGHLVGCKPVVFPLDKPNGTTTYCWRPEEVRAMVDYCRGRPDLAWLEAVIVGLACTGLRISELASLRWSDIDRSTNLINLTDESQRPPKRGKGGRETKSGRSRSLPIFTELVPILDRLKRMPDGLIYHGPHGGRLKPDTVRMILIRDVLRPLTEQFPAVVDAPGFGDGRLHSFRHFFCSACVIKSVPEPMVMEWLGHTESKMVRHYFHMHNEDAQRQMKRLDFLGSGFGGVAGPGEESDG